MPSWPTETALTRGVPIFDFKKDHQWVEDVALVSQVGLTMGGSILFCFAIGYFLDKWLQTKGLFITIFIILGVIGGGFTVYRQIENMLNLKKKAESESGTGDERN
jgi:ATP synthase protein I